MTPRELRQAVIDHVVPRMLAQGKPSIGASTCRYRSGTHNEPLCCAVGFLVDEDKYDFSMEGKSPTILGQMNPTSNPTWQEAFRSEDHFLCDLQDCHDNSAGECARNPHLDFNSEFTRRAKSLAKTYNLQWRY